MEAATRALKLQSIQQRLDSVLVKAAERFVDVNLDASKAPPLFCLQNTLGQTSPGSSHGPGGATLEHASYTFANRSSLGASRRGLAADDGAVSHMILSTVMSGNQSHMLLYFRWSSAPRFPPACITPGPPRQAAAVSVGFTPCPGPMLDLTAVSSLLSGGVSPVSQFAPGPCEPIQVRFQSSASSVVAE